MVFVACIGMREERRTRSGGPEPVRARADLASRRHGVVSAAELRELGFSHATVDREVAAGRLHRIHRGAYAVGHTALTWEGHCLVAVLACAPAVASHSSAAWLWGLFRSRPSTFHISAAIRRHRRDDIRVHYAPLTEADRSVVDEIPVTSVARTLLDVAATSPRRLERSLERAEELGVFDLESVLEVMERVKGNRGVPRLRRALGAYRPTAFTRSDVERRFLELVVDAGLPLPAMNRIVGPYEVDAYWEQERFAVELDIYETHGSRAAFERDRARQEELKLMGVEMIRVTGPRLESDPRGVVGRLGTLLDRRRQEIDPDAS